MEYAPNLSAPDLSAPSLEVPRQPVRTPVLELLTREVVRGDLPADRPVNVAQLATRFGVSVTPVREALIELASAGLVEAPLGRGFVVPPLSAAEVREIYPLIWTLEVFALRQAPPSVDDKRELRHLHTELTQERDPGRALELDRAWHARLLAGYESRTFHELIDALKNRAARYEYAYMRELERVLASADQHRQILAALEANDVAAAAEALEENWRVGLRYLLPWLESVDRS